MSVQDKLTLLTNHLVGAYNAVQTKGGTVPGTKNYNNLSGAIDTVPGGNGGNGGSGSNGGDLYLHLIFFSKGSFASACCKIYSYSSTPYTLDTFKSFIINNGFISQGNCYPAQGTFDYTSFYWRKTNTGTKTQWYYGIPVNGVYYEGTALKLLINNVTVAQNLGTQHFSSKVIKVANAGDKLYMHNLNVVNSNYAMLNGQIITNSATPFTYATFNTFLRDNGFTSNKLWFPMSGMRSQITLYYYSSSSSTTLVQMAQCDTSFGVYSYSTSYVYEVYQTTSTTSPTGKSITSSNFKDTVVEVA